MSLSLFFPLILAYMAKAGTGADTTEHYLQTRFDYVYTMMLGYGLVFLLPCLIGIIAAILFFIERDCDTSKNLRTIPVTNTCGSLRKETSRSSLFHHRGICNYRKRPLA